MLETRFNGAASAIADLEEYPENRQPIQQMLGLRRLISGHMTAFRISSILLPQATGTNQTNLQFVKPGGITIPVVACDIRIQNDTINYDRSVMQTLRDSWMDVLLLRAHDPNAHKRSKATQNLVEKFQTKLPRGRPVVLSGARFFALDKDDIPIVSTDDCVVRDDNFLKQLNFGSVIFFV